MSLKFHPSPFHATYPTEIANKIVMKMDLSIMISKLIRQHAWTQTEAANRLGITQSRVSDLMNAKIDKFTIDTMMDMLEKFGFKIQFSMPNDNHAAISIDRSA
jgi:predicted XRE-type DNA-binding protein